MKKQMSRVTSIILAGVLLLTGIMVNPLQSYAAPVPVPGTWVDVGQPGFSQGLATETSLYVDKSTHTPYVAYKDVLNNNGVTVMKYNGNEWELLGSHGFSIGAANYISLFVENGVPYVSYSDASKQAKVTVKTYVANIVNGVDIGGTWVDMGNPDFSVGAISYTSLYVESGKNGSPSIPYVAYYDLTEGLTVKKYVPNFGWVSLGSTGISAGALASPSLYVVSGTPYVAYSDYANNQKATVKKYNGSTWVDVGSAFSPDVAQFTSLIIDNDIPYVAYSDYANSGKATVMKYDGTGTTGWVPVGSPNFSNWTASELSFYIDNGTPYVAYRDNGVPQAKATVMKYDGTGTTGWVPLGTVGFSANQVKYTSLSVDNGIPYVAYQDFGNGNYTTVMRFLKSSPSLTADTTNNDTAHDIEITFTDDPAWRAAITSVTSNAIPLNNTDYTVSAGKITIKAGVLAVGNPWIGVNATGYSELQEIMQYIKSVGGPQTPILTEDTTNNDTAHDIDIMFTDDPMWRAAINAVYDGVNQLATTDYTVNAGKITIKAGVLAAGSHSIAVTAAGYSDAMVSQPVMGIVPLLIPPSLTADTTNNDTMNAIDITFTDDPAWRGAITGVWDSFGAGTMAATDYTVTAGKITIKAGVLAAGDHSISVEATGYSDAVVIQPVEGIVPLLTPPSLTADTTHNDTASVINITFMDDPAWRSAITAVKDGVTALGVTDYAITAGTITIKVGVLAAGNHLIAVTANVYTDAVVNQPITVVAPPSSSFNDDPEIKPAPPVVPPVLTPLDNNVDIFVDGVKQEMSAKARTEKIGNRSATIVKVDSEKVLAKVEKQLTIPFTKTTAIAVGELDGKLVKAMANKGAMIEIKTDLGTYTLPASQVNMEQMLAQLGNNLNLEDIKISITIAEATQETAELVNKAAKDKGIKVMVKPIDFSVTAAFGDKAVTIDQFNSYVERMIVIPGGVYDSYITTGVVLSHDGSQLYSVPTKVVVQDGIHYAVINSLTNSTYSLVQNLKAFEDSQGHWSYDAINDMASRMVIQGVDETHFNPDGFITRAEFAAIIVRALGLVNNGNTTDFTDVKSDDWYAGAVGKAQKYGIIEGYKDGTFRPGKMITREEAIAIVVRAMKYAGVMNKVDNKEVEAVLSVFADKDSIDSWAKELIASAINNNIVNGTIAGLMPHSDVTRAETVVLVQRMLRAAKLIANTSSK